MEEIPVGTRRFKYKEFKGDYKRKSKTCASPYLILNPLLVTFISSPNFQLLRPDYLFWVTSVLIFLSTKYLKVRDKIGDAVIIEFVTLGTLDRGPNSY